MCETTVCLNSAWPREAVKVAYAPGYNSCRIFALTFGLGTEVVAGSNPDMVSIERSVKTLAILIELLFSIE